MARRRPVEAPPVVVPPVELIPECLRAGRCVEVWASDGRNLVAAFSAWRRARLQWLTLHGIETYDHASCPLALRPSSPWSYNVLAATDPAGLAELLRRRGLPAGWRPSPAPPAWLPGA